MSVFRAVFRRRPAADGGAVGERGARHSTAVWVTVAVGAVLAATGAVLVGDPPAGADAPTATRASLTTDSATPLRGAAAPAAAPDLLAELTRPVPAGVPEAAPAPAAPELLDQPAGSLPVAREGEDGLQMSWALLDTTGEDPAGGTPRWTGSANAATHRTESESTIKAWLSMDTLRAAAEAGRAVTPAERADISAAVRASDNSATERMYRANGREAALARLQPECGVDVATSRPGWWSFTQLSAVDAAAILACVRERATEWPGGEELLVDLRAITPDGRSGVHTRFGPDVSEKNGWTQHGRGFWNVNCVLADDDRALAVLTTYPDDRGVDYGWGVCRDVADDVLAADSR
ncbi:hypothetical protein WIS52_18555 [Pseudonocardia nematodicida]|uniref:Serine hydrolase n=1 Tax=Pseudonocardia nematodicida TaxID=1206997 RepID=A0ABV1KDE4_9PSEU